MEASDGDMKKLAPAATPAAPVATPARAAEATMLSVVCADVRPTPEAPATGVAPTPLVTMPAEPVLMKHEVVEPALLPQKLFIEETCSNSCVFFGVCVCVFLIFNSMHGMHGFQYRIRMRSWQSTPHLRRRETSKSPWRNYCGRIH